MDSSQGDAREFSLSNDDVSAFASKLEEWGNALSPEEQGMLQLLLGRAEAGGAGGKHGLGKEFTLGSRPSETVTQVLRPLLERGATTKLGMMPNRECTWSTWSRGVSP
jgi:hypothetical protein